MQFDNKYNCHYFRQLSVFLILSFVTLYGQSQTLKNTSYINNSGEKVLRFECLLPNNLTQAWEFFTSDDKLKKWISPLAHVELKSGGYILTNYDSLKSLTDSSSIRLPIISFIDKLSEADGRVICKSLKDNDALAQIPILMMSAHPNAKSDCLNAGSDAFLTKPFEMQSFY